MRIRFVDDYSSASMTHAKGDEIEVSDDIGDVLTRGKNVAIEVPPEAGGGIGELSIHDHLIDVIRAPKPEDAA